MKVLGYVNLAKTVISSSGHLMRETGFGRGESGVMAGHTQIQGDTPSYTLLNIFIGIVTFRTFPVA